MTSGSGRCRQHGDLANRRFQEIFTAYLNGSPRPNAPQEDSYANYIVLFAPGWDYVENGKETGADLARPIEIANGIGLESRLVPLEPTGSVEANAPIAQAAIEEAASAGKKVVVVSASSAGPIVHVAIDRIRRIGGAPPVAWINLGGILKGAPLYETHQRFPRSLVAQFVCAAEDWRKSDLASMGRQATEERLAALQIDGQTLVVNYIGLSLSGNLSKYAKRMYPALKKLGPNASWLCLEIDVSARRSAAETDLRAFSFSPSIRDLPPVTATPERLLVLGAIPDWQRLRHFKAAQAPSLGPRARLRRSGRACLLGQRSPTPRYARALSQIEPSPRTSRPAPRVAPPA